MFCFSDLPDASAVHGILTKDGLFDGHISTPLEEYYIEPASRYFTNNKNKKKKDSDQPQQGPLFHSVIYKASDVVHPTASPTSEDGSSEVMYTLYVLCRYLPTKPPVQSIMSHSHVTVSVFLIFSGHFCKHISIIGNGNLFYDFEDNFFHFVPNMLQSELKMVGF